MRCAFKVGKEFGNMATKKKLAAEDGKAAATVVDETEATHEQRLKDVEDYATRIDDVLGSAIERIERLESKSGGGKGSDVKALTERVAKLEGDAAMSAQALVHPSADNPPRGTDSMGLPKVV